jgi:hypothetical protein
MKTAGSAALLFAIFPLLQRSPTRKQGAGGGEAKELKAAPTWC